MRPARRGDGWAARLPGLLMLIALTVASTVVFFLDVIRRSLEEGPEIVVLAAEARGLVPGAEVWIAGSPSGRVTRVTFADPEGAAESRVAIHATLHRAAVPYLGAAPLVAIGSASLLAPVVLKLSPRRKPAGPFEASDTLTVPSVRTAERFLRLGAEARGALDSLAAVSAELSTQRARAPGTVDLFRRDTALARTLGALARDARTVQRAATSPDALPARIGADSLGPALARMVALAATLRDDDAAGVAREIGALAAGMERISANLDRLDRELRAGRGTAGRALYDDELARQQQALRARMDTVTSELKRKPWRWLRLKLF